MTTFDQWLTGQQEKGFYSDGQQLAVPYCGDCLRPINECHHGKGNE